MQVKSECDSGRYIARRYSCECGGGPVSASNERVGLKHRDAQSFDEVAKIYEAPFFAKLSWLTDTKLTVTIDCRFNRPRFN